MKLVLDRNLDIAVQRLNPQAFDFSLSGLRAAYRLTATSTLSEQSATTPSTQTISGGTVGTGIVAGTTTYNGLQVDGLNGALIGIPTVTVHVKGVQALANSVTPTTPTKLDFGALTVLPFTFDAALTHSIALHLSGAVAVSAPHRQRRSAFGQ